MGNSIIEAQETLKDEELKILGQEIECKIQGLLKKSWFEIHKESSSIEKLIKLLYSEPISTFTKDYYVINVPRTNKK